MVDRISGDWGGRVMTEIDAVFDAVAKMPFTDSRHMGIAGASYGGYAVNWILGHTNRFKVAVTHDGVFNLESMSMATEELWFPEWEFGGRPWDPKARAQFAKWSPHRFVQNIRTPTLIITNEQDFRVPVDQGLQMFTARLARGGVRLDQEVSVRGQLPVSGCQLPAVSSWKLEAGHWKLETGRSRFTSSRYARRHWTCAREATVRRCRYPLSLSAAVAPRWW